ncbi:hypothetical protein BOTBODRAFT_45115 [Botryobasidium botryosum FD-172 SS1]|uniref:Homeobox domain-containing protein n=1 Tax=Botryobasidium botryosum (strain FD-172 SS1) TaxID=930990 RepID=A0A067MQ21_BOTB1|nr:hypothetical protein BOTBODRAFT_45115 [Botryobasidium botryosum FD-172 SS1]
MPPPFSQTHVLEDAFARDPAPSPDGLQAIADHAGIALPAVQNWFESRRRALPAASPPPVPHARAPHASPPTNASFLRKILSPTSPQSTTRSSPERLTTPYPRKSPLLAPSTASSSSAHTPRTPLESHHQAYYHRDRYPSHRNSSSAPPSPLSDTLSLDGPAYIDDRHHKPQSSSAPPSSHRVGTEIYPDSSVRRQSYEWSSPHNHRSTPAWREDDHVRHVPRYGHHNRPEALSIPGDDRTSRRGRHFESTPQGWEASESCTLPPINPGDFDSRPIDPTWKPHGPPKDPRELEYGADSDREYEAHIRQRRYDHHHEQLHHASRAPSSSAMMTSAAGSSTNFFPATPTATVTSNGTPTPPVPGYPQMAVSMPAPGPQSTAPIILLTTSRSFSPSAMISASSTATGARGGTGTRKLHRCTPPQVAVLEREFSANAHPERAVKVRLADELDMPYYAVVNWFHNRRAKRARESGGASGSNSAAASLVPAPGPSAPGAPGPIGDTRAMPLPMTTKSTVTPAEFSATANSLVRHSRAPVLATGVGGASSKRKRGPEYDEDSEREMKGRTLHGDSVVTRHGSAPPPPPLLPPVRIGNSRMGDIEASPTGSSGAAHLLQRSPLVAPAHRIDDTHGDGKWKRRRADGRDYDRDATAPFVAAGGDGVGVADVSDRESIAPMATHTPSSTTTLQRHSASPAPSSRAPSTTASAHSSPRFAHSLEMQDFPTKPLSVDAFAPHNLSQRALSGHGHGQGQGTRHPIATNVPLPHHPTLQHHRHHPHRHHRPPSPHFPLRPIGVSASRCELSS